MTKEECVKIMAMLGAFYSGGKNDPKAQSNAWYLILGKYDFSITQRAVLHFAENDTRDYATFPTVGRIVTEIKAEQLRIERPIKEIIRSVAYGYEYDTLTDNAKSLIWESLYNEWLKMDAEDFANKADECADILKGKRDRLLESSNG